MPTDASFAIYVRDREDATVGEIRDALCEVTLADGTPALDGVWTVTELYGQSQSDGPLLFIAPANGVRLSAALKEPILHVPQRPGRGCHQQDGIVLLAGAGTKATDVSRLSIYDIAPTLLWAMGAGVPRGLDGRVVFEAFNEAFAETRQVNEVEVSMPETAMAPDGESGEVTRRLKALGYI
jgi:predicted AlkP superfamily phosphohydrolase/phosphomutase